MAPARHLQLPGGRKPFYLGTLAPELLDKILLEIDSVRTLGNFFTTCCVVYRRFEREKERIIFRILQNEFGPVLPVYRVSSWADFSDSDSWALYWHKSHAASAMYWNMLARSRDGGINAVPSFAELTELCCALHQINLLESTLHRGPSVLVRQREATHHASQQCSTGAV